MFGNWYDEPLPLLFAYPIEDGMTKKTAIAAAGAIGSAAIAAALLYANKRKQAKDGEQPPKTSTAPKTPTGEQPETD